MCHCKFWQPILLLIIVAFTFWDSTIAWLPSKWVVLAAALGLLLHEFLCKCCSIKGHGKEGRSRKKRRR